MEPKTITLKFKADYTSNGLYFQALEVVTVTYLGGGDLMRCELHLERPARVVTFEVPAVLVEVVW